jgi:Cu(I)/Ag(I) efflux system membrane fusion protein
MKRVTMFVLVLVAIAAAIAAWSLRERIVAVWRPQPGEAVESAGHAGHGDQGEARGIDEPRVAIEVPPEQQARIGVHLATLEERDVQHTIRAVGLVAVDQRLESHVHTRVSGYIERIYVNAVGDRVRRGQALYRIYSPDVVATEYEYVASAGKGELSARIAEAALERLALWGVPTSEITRLKRERKVQRTIPFVAPTSGVVISKTALQGMYVTPEMELYHLADLSKVWVIVTLYEHELPLVKVGDRAQIGLASLPDGSIEGVIEYVYPEVDLATRTARARIEVDNSEGLLKPGMFATATLSRALGSLLLVPDDAVLATGLRQIVFVQHTDTRFEPHEVELGPRIEGGYVVHSGLRAGDRVVVRANFLIDAESRLQAALQRGEAPAAGHADHGEGHADHG